jgi:AcrR family transcriptional regulator
MEAAPVPPERPHVSPLARYDRLDPAKQRRIMDAATAEFVEKGYDEASVNQIIAAAGISKGSFYYYFEDKTDLFVAVLREHMSFDDLIDFAHLEEATCHDEFWQFTREISHEAMRRADENPALVRLGMITAALPTSVREHHSVLEFYAEASEYIVRMIATGQRIGAIRTDLPTPVLVKLWVAVDTTLSEWGASVWDDAGGRDEVIDVTLDAFQRLFSAPEASTVNTTPNRTSDPTT